MATKSAGRVSIRVLPDSTRFKRDLETSLRRIERQLTAKIEAELFLSRASLAKLKRQIESLVVKIKPTIDLNVTPAQIAELKAKIEAMKPKIKVQLDTAAAAARVAALSRTRRINMVPFLDNNVLANFGRKMAGLTGLNVLVDSFREGVRFMENIDRNAVKIGKMFTMIGGIASMVGVLTQNMIVMVSQLASMGNIALLAPGFMTGFAIGVTALVLALKDMGTVLADLGPQFSRLQDSMSKKFWEEAEAPVRSLVEKLFPVLEAQLNETSRLMGTLFAGVAQSVERNATPEVMTRMFERMNRAIDISRGAIEPLTRAFIKLGDHGSKYFERFSTWIVKISEQFGSFIDRAAEDGSLERWTEQAIQGFKDLGNVLRGVVRVFASINEAAKAAGGANLGDLGASLNRAADIMNSPRFQKSMTELFRSMNTSVESIISAIGRLGPSIEKMMPQITNAFETSGRIIAKLIDYMGDIMDNPRFRKGIDEFLRGIELGVSKLEPAMGPLADSLGGVLSILGQVASIVGGLIATFLIEFGPTIDLIGDAFARISFVAGPAIQEIMKGLGPPIRELIDKILPPLEDLLKKIIPLVADFIKAVGPDFVSTMGDAVDALTPFAEGLGKVLEQLNKGDWWEAGNQAILGLMDGFASGFAGAWEDAFDPNRQTGIDAWLDFLDDFGREFAAGWDKSMAWLGNNLFSEGATSQLDATVNKWFDDVLFRPIREGWEDFLRGMEEWYEGIKRGFQGWMEDVFGFDKFFEETLGGGGMAGGGAGGVGRGVPGMLTQKWNLEDMSFMDKFKALVEGKWQEFWTGIGENFASFGTEFTTNWTTFWDGVGTKVEQIWTEVTTWINTKSSEIKTNIETFSADTKKNWDTFWADISTKVQTTWDEMWTWINTKTGEIRGNIDRFVTDVRNNWNGFWGGIAQTVADGWSSAQQWVARKAFEIYMNVINFIQDVRGNWDGFWGSIGWAVQNGWNWVVETIRQGVDNSVSWIRSLPGRALESLSNMGGWLVGAGQSLIQGFINGMWNMLQSVRNTASSIVQAVRNFFPFSPAKEGPFSGMGYTTFSGRALVKDFADGMMASMSKVRSATRSITEAAQLSSRVDVQADLEKDGVVIDRRQVTLNNYNPVAEPTSRTIEKAANTFRMGKTI